MEIIYKIQFRGDGTYRIVLVSLHDLTTRFMSVSLKQLKNILTLKVNQNEHTSGIHVY